MFFNREMNYQYRIPCSYVEKKKRGGREENGEGKKMGREGEVRGTKRQRKTKPNRKCVLLTWI